MYIRLDKFKFGFLKNIAPSKTLEDLKELIKTDLKYSFKYNMSMSSVIPKRDERTITLSEIFDQDKTTIYLSQDEVVIPERYSSLEEYMEIVLQMIKNDHEIKDVMLFQEEFINANFIW